MNVLNQQTAKANSSASLLDAASFVPRGAIFTVTGQVLDWQIGLAGRIACTLRLSLGDLALHAKRTTLPLHIGHGDWIRAEIFHAPDAERRMVLVSAAVTAPAPDQTSWVPVALYHRNAAMRELRRLLSALEPGLQGMFMSVTLDYQLQRNFFWRPAALDHHCYPGGLFDASVRAASIANQAKYADERGRGVATLASLLFEIGKATDPRLLPDRTRRWPVLQPPMASVACLNDPLARLAKSAPPLASDLADLWAFGAERTAQLPPRTLLLRKQVRDAVRTSWGPSESFLTNNHPGAMS